MSGPTPSRDESTAAFQEWWDEWRHTIPANRPIGMYNLEDLHTAFRAGMMADFARGLNEIVRKIAAAVSESRPPRGPRNV